MFMLRNITVVLHNTHCLLLCIHRSPLLTVSALDLVGPIPCKYHHSPTGCYRGDQCRFSHDQLTEETNEILQQVRMYIYSRML